MERAAFLDAISTIQAQFDAIAGEGNVKVLDELAFMRLRNEDIDRRFFVVVRYGGATTNYGQTSLPISMTACGFVDRTDVLKTVLTEYALTYNLSTEAEIGGDYCIQFWNTPTVVQNFSEIAEGFCSLFALSGYIVFGDNANHIYEVEYEYAVDDGVDTETLQVISANLSLSIANNTQPKLAGKGLANSVGQYGTLSVSFSAYLTDSRLLNDLLDVAADPTYDKIDKTYHLTIHFKNGKKIEYDWRLASFAPSQNLGALPMATMAFTL